MENYSLFTIHCSLFFQLFPQHFVFLLYPHPLQRPFYCKKYLLLSKGLCYKVKSPFMHSLYSSLNSTVSCYDDCWDILIKSLDRLKELYPVETRHFQVCNEEVKTAFLG